MTTTNVAVMPKRNSLQNKFATRFNIDEQEVMNILKSTAFKQRDNSPPVTNEQMTALMIVADQYGLNPFVREIYAYPDKNNGIVPVVGVDGWSRIMNDHPQMNGIEFKYSDETVTHKGKNVHVWIECHISRKDRSKPIVIREFFDEVLRSATFPTAWDSHPKRMHRHKAEIQCARVAFGFAGIFDEDEAERIIEKDVTPAKDESKTFEQPSHVEEQIFYVSDEDFEANKEKWAKSVTEGKKTKGSLVIWIQSKGKVLTDYQLKTINSWVEPVIQDAEVVGEIA